MAKSLVIVESPAKARTINKFLGRDFTVMASVGHIKDLPKSKLGIDIENGFTPHYVNIKGKAEIIRELKKAGKLAERIYLAPDPDREGEAIAWHIAEEIDSLRQKTKRVLFNEITEKAVKDAIKHPIELDRSKFEAQQARRVLDRLVGYQVSPLLWDKVRRGLSAGRVQSVAVRLVCGREKEVLSFIPQEYWSLTADLECASGEKFSARLIKKDGKKIELKSGGDATSVIEGIKGAGFSVHSIEQKETRRNPSAPFTTSKLQQDSSRKLGFTAKKTMMLAQQLYEGIDIGQEGPVGLISYKRTDSVRLSGEAVDAARSFIEAKYGLDYLPQKPNVYKTKGKAQDAHEAIRPTYMKYTPETIKAHLSKDQFRLYELIWKRFVACQMTPAVIDATRVEISAGNAAFQANGSVVRFPGFTAVYVEGRDEEEEKEEKLPRLNKGETLKLLNFDPRQHFTQPPPRYTEASLVKELEENGIGRPSTYAAILSTVQDRGYVIKEKGRLRPTELGFLVTDMLIESFPEVLDIEFTAHMEQELDSIEDGKRDWQAALKEFYGPFSERLKKAGSDMKNVKQEETPTDVVCAKCGKPMVIKWGRKGKFLACTGFPECKNTQDFTMDEHGRVTPIEKVAEVSSSLCPKCSSPMLVKTGRFGRFLACSRYPECKGTLSLTTGIPCPEDDGGELVERRTKKGRVFFGCSKYPKCTYATWELQRTEASGAEDKPGNKD
ncbi:MAG: type I DNA topoisomerase [Deltaproteobacteria bacterium]